MSKLKKSEVKASTPPVVDPTYYTIKRVNSGYSVFNSKGEKVTEENMLLLTFKALENILRKDIGL